MSWFSKVVALLISADQTNFGTKTTLVFNSLLVSLSIFEIRSNADIEIKRISKIGTLAAHQLNIAAGERAKNKGRQAIGYDADPHQR